MNENQKKYLDFIINDVLGDIDNITSRAMFGGYGIYKDNIIFAIIAEITWVEKAVEASIASKIK